MSSIGRASGLPSARGIVDGYRGSLIGTGVVAYLLAFGRWGSHVHVGFDQLYVTDILLALSVVAWWRAGGRLASIRRAPLGLYLVLAIPVIAVIRVAAARSISADGLRDVAPYIYAAVALFALTPRPADAAHRTYRVLRIALIIHLILVTIALLRPSLFSGMPQVTPPGPESRALSIRPDFASACFVVLALSAVQRLLVMRSDRPTPTRSRVLEMTLIVWSVAVILRLGARSGLIALMVAVLCVGLQLARRFTHIRLWVRILFAVGAVAVLVLALPRLHAFTRLTDTAQAFGIGVDTSKDSPPDAAGTAHARLEAWRRTVRYTNASASRRTVGVGFGPNFLRDSGAEQMLVGLTKDGKPFYSGVRAPHNYLLNTYARMGIIGLGVVLAALLSVLASAIRLMRHGPSEFDVLAVAVFVAIVIVAMFGVILESPFAAIPAFWAAGWIVARRVRTPGDLGERRTASAGAGRSVG